MSDPAPTPSPEPTDRHQVPVRDPQLDFDCDIPRHWAPKGPLATHIFNALNLTFPDGERFFIRSVRDHLDAIDDPELISQVRGFFGQEGHHAKAHERYFATLERQGYRIRPYLRGFRRFIQLNNRWIPAPLRLSMTAAAEHYTATLGHLALHEPEIRKIHPTMQRLIVWHACEEIEHKAVAYDVLQATHPSYALRILGFVLATTFLLGWAALGARMLLIQDGFDRRARRRLRAELRAQDEGRHDEALGRALRAYLRRDFHPSQVDDLPLAQARLAELELAPS